MNVQREYLGLCQSIDQVQWQLVKCGKKDNVFLQTELKRKQGQLKELIKMATGKQVQNKPEIINQEPNNPNRREDI